MSAPSSRALSSEEREPWDDAFVDAPVYQGRADPWWGDCFLCHMGTKARKPLVRCWQLSHCCRGSKAS